MKNLLKLSLFIFLLIGCKKESLPEFYIVSFTENGSITYSVKTEKDISYKLGFEINNWDTCHVSNTIKAGYYEFNIYRNYKYKVKTVEICSIGYD